MLDRKNNRLSQVIIITFLLGIINLFIISCAEESAKKETVPSLDAPIVFKWRFCGLGLKAGGFDYWTDLKPHITKEDLENPEQSPVIKHRIEQLKEWGYNAMAYGIPDKPMADFLKKNGFSLFVQRNWNEFEGTSSRHNPRMDRSRKSRKLCPYSEDVKEYWRNRIAEDYEKFPGLDGYCPMRGTQGYMENGAPWMCDCEECQKRTPRERTRDAICLIAGLLAEHGGTLIWETTQDDPEGMRYEGNYFKNLTGEIPENAFIMIKPFYWDFHPRWPRPPVFFSTSKDDQGKSPYMTYFQEPGEYRGMHRFPWCMVDEWSDVFRDMANMGQQGLLVGNGVYTVEYWAHPLNMVNMYAMARFMRDPYADPKAIKIVWAKEQFGEESAATVVKVVDNVTEAARGMYEFDALWTGNHSQFPTLEYLDSHLCGPYRENERIDGLMGMEFPLDMYEPEKAAEFKNNPQTRMLFNPISYKCSIKIRGNGAEKQCGESDETIHRIVERSGRKI